MPYKYALNNLTRAEMLEIQKEVKKVDRACDYCGEVFQMFKAQRFCCAQHRVAMGRLVKETDMIRLNREVESLRKDNQELLREIEALRKELKGRD